MIGVDALPAGSIDRRNNVIVGGAGGHRLVGLCQGIKRRADEQGIRGAPGFAAVDTIPNQSGLAAQLSWTLCETAGAGAGLYVGGELPTGEEYALPVEPLRLEWTYGRVVGNRLATCPGYSCGTGGQCSLPVRPNSPDVCKVVSMMK